SALRPCAGADPPPGRAALARARSAARVVQALVELLHLRKLFESGIDAADLLEGLSRGRRISQTDGEVKEVGGGLPVIRVPALGLLEQLDRSHGVPRPPVAVPGVGQEV